MVCSISLHSLAVYSIVLTQLSNMDMIHDCTYIDFLKGH